MIMFPVMLAPIRRQITRDYNRWLEDPTTKTSGGAMAWITISMIVMLLLIAAGWAVGISTSG